MKFHYVYNMALQGSFTTKQGMLLKFHVSVEMNCVQNNEFQPTSGFTRQHFVAQAHWLKKFYNILPI